MSSGGARKTNIPGMTPPGPCGADRSKIAINAFLSLSVRGGNGSFAKLVGETIWDIENPGVDAGGPRYCRIGRPRERAGPPEMKPTGCDYIVLQGCRMGKTLNGPGPRYRRR